MTKEASPGLRVTLSGDDGETVELVGEHVIVLVADSEQMRCMATVSSPAYLLRALADHGVDVVSKMIEEEGTN